jgi:hypothetical protein
VGPKCCASGGVSSPDSARVPSPTGFQEVPYLSYSAHTSTGTVILHSDSLCILRPSRWYPTLTPYPDTRPPSFGDGNFFVGRTKEGIVREGGGMDDYDRTRTGKDRASENLEHSCTPDSAFTEENGVVVAKDGRPTNESI